MSSAAYFSVENEVLNSVKEVATNEMIDAGQVGFQMQWQWLQLFISDGA
jgi:hypothetical protein